MSDARRRVPSVDAVLRATPADALERRRLVPAVREVLADARSAGRDILDPAAYAKLARERVAKRDAPTLRPVINATGVVLHTNLGRAPLSEAALAAIRDASGTVSVEYDLERGARGERHGHAARLLAEVTGAQDAVVANNGAAAVLLALAALAARREVIVARGELVEIGGGFRIPDVLARSGAKLVEVGTTNRTYVRDYANAITEKTGAILRVHASNFALRGFVAKAASSDLAKLARERGVAFIHDLGSGTLLDTARFGLGREETVQEAVKDGADVVTFSGDKLLGGPQAGIIVGRVDLIAKMRRNPLKRALRVDKMTLAALAALLRLYSNPERIAERIPALRLLSRPVEEIRAQAERLRPLVQARVEETVEVVRCESQVGSGAAPTGRIASAGLGLRPGSARLARAFRALPTPVIGRLQEGAFILDLRCLDDEAAFAAQLARL